MAANRDGGREAVEVLPPWGSPGNPLSDPAPDARFREKNVARHSALMPCMIERIWSIDEVMDLEPLVKLTGRDDR
jgi:hypothetical protein